MFDPDSVTTNFLNTLIIAPDGKTLVVLCRFTYPPFSSFNIARMSELLPVFFTDCNAAATRLIDWFSVMYTMYHYHDILQALLSSQHCITICQILPVLIPTDTDTTIRVSLYIFTYYLLFFIT